MNCFKPMLVIIFLLMLCTIVQGFNKPYLTVDNNHQIVFVTDVNGAEVKQPFHISGVGLYSEVADERTIGSNGDIQTAISHIAAARNRMLRLFCCHFSDVPYQDVPFQQLHVPFKRSGATFDVTGFNLSSQYPEKHDTDWRSRLRAAIDKAKDPDGDAATQDAVIIQLSLFDHCDLVNNGYWPNSAWNGNNNNSGDGAGVQIIRDSAKGNGMPYFFLTDPDDAFTGSDDSWTVIEANRLKEIQKNYVRQIVFLTADDWNVMYEIMNEPGNSGIKDVVDATPDQVLDWHEDVRSWIIEALMEHGGGQILTPHLISISSPDDNNKGILYGPNNFEIVSIHSGALGWDNERKTELEDREHGVDLIDTWDPCDNPNPPVDYPLNISLERQYLQNMIDPDVIHFPTGKHIIVDTDGMWGFGEPNLHKGWGRDYDEICYHLMNIGLMEGFSFNSKELAHNQLNQNEVDCDRTGDYPWESTFQGMDKPYIDGVNSQISEVFMRPEVYLAGYGYSFLTPGEADGQLFVYKTNPYGNSEITNMSLKLTDVDSITTETDLTETTGNPNTTFGSYSFNLGTVCETNIFFPNLVISTQANNYERCWPELTIIKSRNTDTLPSSFSGLPPVSETAYDVICDKMNEQNNFQPVVLNQTWDQMIAFKNYIQAHSNQDTAQLSAPCVFAAGFVKSRIIDIYGGKVLFAAIIDHPKGVAIADVKISCDGVQWNSMTPIIEYPNVLYIFDLSLDFGELASLSADEFFPVLVKAIDANGNQSDIWPELIVHDVNGNPSDNYRPAVKTPDTTPPVFSINQNPKASGWEFYSDKLKLTWYDAVNTFGFKEKNATYDVLVGPSGALILNPVIGDFTGNSYLVEGLQNCTKYDFEVVPRDPCGNVGSKYRGTAYTGNPEIPFGFSYENGYLKWNKRKWKDWESYQVYRFVSAGGWVLHEETTECKLYIGQLPTHRVVYKVRIFDNGIAGCFSDTVTLPDGTGLIGKSLLLLDMNNDGLLDAIVENNTGESVAYYQDSDGLLSSVAFTIPASSKDIDIADLNNDMILDLIYIDGTTVKLLLNADSVFVETDDFDITNTSTSDIQSSDLDNQGDKEVIITDDEKVTVAKKTEDAGYVVSSTIETTGDVLLELGDVDGDAYNDIILANTNGLIQVLKNDGTGEMTEIFSFNVDSQFQSVRLTDSDLDWDLDLEIVYPNETKTYFNDGTGYYHYGN